MFMALVRDAVGFLRTGATHCPMIWRMAVQDLQKRYIGTLAGLVWSVIHPFMMILVYWFVFARLFHASPLQGAPFVVVFFCGFAVWTLFAETLNASTAAIVANPHLVKKVIFPTEVLPLVNLTSGLISHAIMLVIFVCLMLTYGIRLSIYNLQFLYYVGALCVFSLGLAWFFSALNAFYRDVGQILTVILNVWFWVTPIVWSLEIAPLHYRKWIELNPMCYIVQGYKYSFVYHVPFWSDIRQGFLFWIMCLMVLSVGVYVFKRLKPEFPEVL
jgi:lipopolysaccharide transport system permease protein/teichoic acid transport system permease protein